MKVSHASGPKCAGGTALLVMLSLLLLGGLSPAAAQRKEPPPSRAAVQFSYAPIVKRAAPAVVNVYARGRVAAQPPGLSGELFRDFFRDRFGMSSERVQSALGSGVIVSPDGVIVTNTHVVKVGATSEIRVVLADRREFDARIVLQDEKTDIAILRIDGGDGKFPSLQFDDSDNLEVGDLVLAIGNPFGVGQTVTSGIISALGRSEIGRADIQSYIQTDAAINPGNSGGALVDMSGRLIGINTAIYSGSGGSHGVGFAIPSNLVRLYVESALSGKKIQRPWLGARLDSITREIAEGLRLSRSSGALVTRVHKDGPAAAAGIEPGDVITMVDGHEVTDARAVNYRLATRGIGHAVQINLIRKGRAVALQLPLQPPPQIGADDVRNLTGNHPFDGARIANLVPHVADELDLDEAGGIVVLSVRSGSVAERLNFRPGDIIISIGDQQVTSVVDLEKLLARRTQLWRIVVKRGRQVVQLQIPG
ncbi:Do family serine endopeptidase [Hyphomicrobium sp. CS1BSMeth3]|uniref:Do family serine endopeptidase n=1 Tax=Hyphomicrobium sp. CS1BSMeth3 TaxID=1892844 RepID=UPI00157517D0|nr:Do family serine endopeptidase [Hyphomicrobium sp. CS1BSMeth3]